MTPATHVSTVGTRTLVVNAGSTSVKLSLINDAGKLIAGTHLPPQDEHLAGHLENFLRNAGPVDAVGHRVVHGGPYFTTTTRVTPKVREVLEGLNALAPIHNPPALSGIDTTLRLLPTVPQFACFDTAFHATLPPEAASYAVPTQWVTKWGIHRYGFHGISCAWAAPRAAQLLNRPVEGLRLVICHLGGGASATAVSGGRSVDTTMGFTPLEGLVMATRPGDLDAGALLWVLAHGLSPDDASDALERHSGLLGASDGRSGDMRELLVARAQGVDGAGSAIALYLHRLRAKIAAMSAATAGTDAIIFTGGVGENSAPVRAETCARLKWLGVHIDEAANNTVTDADRDISLPEATTRTLVIHCREDLQIAIECRRALHQA